MVAAAAAATRMQCADKMVHARIVQQQCSGSGGTGGISLCCPPYGATWAGDVAGAAQQQQKYSGCGGDSSSSSGLFCTKILSATCLQPYLYRTPSNDCM
jgi:hypothetical protein